MKIYFHEKEIVIDDGLYEKAAAGGCHFTQTEIDGFCVTGADHTSGMVDTRGEPGFSIDDILFSSTEDEIADFIAYGIEKEYGK